jgi:hypothetical protein
MCFKVSAQTGNSRLVIAQDNVWIDYADYLEADMCDIASGQINVTGIRDPNATLGAVS